MSIVKFFLIVTICTVGACQKSKNNAPIAEANFLANKQACVGSDCEVKFFDKSINAISYRWDFGNGETSILKNPISTFELNQDYIITLTVMNGDQIESKKLKSLTF